MTDLIEWITMSIGETPDLGEVRFVITVKLDKFGNFFFHIGAFFTDLNSDQLDDLFLELSTACQPKTIMIFKN